MIYDALENLKLYLSRDIADLLVDFINKCGPATEEKKYELIADKLLVRCMSGATKERDKALFESHRKYVDIQCVITGREIIDVHPTEKTSVSEMYSAERDCTLHKLVGPDYSSVMMVPGMFALLGPQDAHRPMITAGCGPEPIKKIVVKADVSLIYR